MRVMMLIQSYHPSYMGGAELQLTALAPLLMERGVEVHVVTRRHKGMSSYEVMDGVKVHRAPTLEIFRMEPLTATLYALYVVLQTLRLKPSVIHAHGLFSPTVAGLFAKRIFGVPVVAKVLRGGVLGDVVRVKNKWLGNRRMANLRDNVDAFIVISEEIRAELIAEGVPETRCHYIPNGVDIDRFKPVDPEIKRRLRAEKQIADVPTVIYVGRLVAAKRVANLIESWKCVSQTFPEAQLVIVGMGSQEAPLRAEAGDRVHFVGKVDDVPTYMQLGDVYVLPSVSEGLSNSLLEAMATGLPIIATAVGEAPRLIRSSEDGWLIPPDDVQALTDSLTSALEDTDRTRGIGVHNRQRILSDFQLSVTADKLVQLYRAVRKERGVGA
jgi:glycosyltransferase involved in cell wall biosynthesis